MKADAVLRESRFLCDEGVATPADVLHASPEKLDAIRAQWVSVPGQGSGLSLDCFLMLSGLPGVKADSMVRRFVAAALELPNELAISAEDAGVLVREAARSVEIEDASSTTPSGGSRAPSSPDSLEARCSYTREGASRRLPH